MKVEFMKSFSFLNVFYFNLTRKWQPKMKRCLMACRYRCCFILDRKLDFQVVSKNLLGINVLELEVRFLVSLTMDLFKDLSMEEIYFVVEIIFCYFLPTFIE